MPLPRGLNCRIASGCRGDGPAWCGLGYCIRAGNADRRLLQTGDPPKAVGPDQGVLLSRTLLSLPGPAIANPGAARSGFIGGPLQPAVRPFRHRPESMARDAGWLTLPDNQAAVRLACRRRLFPTKRPLPCKGDSIACASRARHRGCAKESPARQEGGAVDQFPERGQQRPIRFGRRSRQLRGGHGRVPFNVAYLGTAAAQVRCGDPSPPDCRRPARLPRLASAQSANLPGMTGSPGQFDQPTMRSTLCLAEPCSSS